MTATWGAWLKHKRGKRGEPGFITQGELARRMNVSRTYVAQLEEMNESPTYPTRQKVHEALGTTEEDLVALGIVRDPLQGTYPRTTSERPLREVSPRSDDPVARKARFVDSLSDDQKAFLMDLIGGVITLDEIPNDPPSERTTRRASGD